MCKEAVPRPLLKMNKSYTSEPTKKPSSECSHTHKKAGNHHEHDDHPTKAHPKKDTETNHQHAHHETEHQHHLHDDVVSLAHRHHDHQHLPFMQQQAAARSHSCHAGDGHNHGESVSKGGTISSMPFIKPSFGGGGHHHHEGEHEHCPNCDEHLVDHECPKCGYKHQH
jgi:hypothetical protein